ncbi:UBP-type zinc finger domain-containing protein [Deinococcus sp.]|uniref:UBP-type zinc finger domain-containing protein n=1 Tax=Deinococcus sp. TaxID=47478 RepID=UPI003C7B6CB8
MTTCTHASSLLIIGPPEGGPFVCEDCVKTGDTWVHLRMCSTCGHIGCCDSSKNRHATRHFRNSGHPLIRSVEPGETWVWCYLDQTVLP